jgi:hypothetical protein
MPGRCLLKIKKIYELASLTKVKESAFLVIFEVFEMLAQGELLSNFLVPSLKKWLKCT